LLSHAFDAERHGLIGALQGRGRGGFNNRGGPRGRGAPGGGGGGGGGRGGPASRGGPAGRGRGAGPASKPYEKPPILDLSKYKDKKIRVKFSGGREGELPCSPLHREASR
jgi:U6 snRNA-associated Sm-like protein LSm7